MKGNYVYGSWDNYVKNVILDVDNKTDSIKEKNTDGDEIVNTADLLKEIAYVAFEIRLGYECNRQ